MIKFTALLCFVASTTGQWMDPHWSDQMMEYPPLPGSYPVNNLFEVTLGPTFAADTTTSKFPPTGIPTTGIPTTEAPPPPAPGKCLKVFGCSDCNTVQICRPTMNGLVPQATFPCPTTSPYCDSSSGTCSKYPNPECGSADQFICTGDGYFPDATACNVYHTCNNYTAKKFKCAEGQNYDPDASRCVSNSTCNFNVVCTSKTEVKVEMGDSHFFTYCSTGVPLIVSRCPGEYKLNTTSQNCEPICERDGLMTDLADCTRFYKCWTQFVKQGWYIPVRENLPCPTDEAFDPNSFQCIPKTLTKCNK